MVKIKTFLLMSNLAIYGFALLFLCCPTTVTGGLGGTGSGQEEAKKVDEPKPLLVQIPQDSAHHPHIHPSHVTDTENKQFYPEIDEAREYVIQIAVKFSDGGDILMDRAYKIKDVDYKYYKVVPIETLLKDVNGLDGVKYVKIDEDNDGYNKLTLKEKVNKGAKLMFEKPFHKILVSAAKEDGGADKEEAGETKEYHDFNIVFDKHVPGRDSGHYVDIKSVVEVLAKPDADWRWHISGRDEDEEKHIFQSLFDAHAMVALSEKVRDPATGKENLEEVARFHFNSQGLNLFKKREKKGEKKGVNYIVNPDTQTEEQKEFYVQRNRGLYKKHEFRERLVTKNMTITEMKDIALAVIGKRKWGGPFKCRHFVYNFIRSIVPEASLHHLNDIAVWPENMRVMDEHYRENLDGSYAFDGCLNFSFEDWVKVGQKEQGGTTSEHDSGKGGDKEHGHVHGQVHHVKEEKKPIETRQARHDG